MEPVYEPLVSVSVSVSASGSAVARNAGSAVAWQHTSRLRRFLGQLREDPVGERFAHERERDERLLAR